MTPTTRNPAPKTRVNRGEAMIEREPIPMGRSDLVASAKPSAAPFMLVTSARPISTARAQVLRPRSAQEVGHGRNPGPVTAMCLPSSRSR
jgi:hypothetical protein